MKVPPPTFSAKQVCTALEISRGMLNNWASDGYFKDFDAEAAKPGLARQFSLDDLYRLAIFRLLLDHGVPANQAQGWAILAVKYMKGPLRPQKLRFARGIDPESMLLDEQTVPGHEPTVEIVIYLNALTNQMRQRLGLAPNTGPGAPNRAPEGQVRIFPARRSSVNN